MTIPQTNTFYSSKFQHFSQQISTMKAMQVYNLASVMVVICRLERVRQRQQYSIEGQPRMHPTPSKLKCGVPIWENSEQVLRITSKTASFSW